MSSLLFSSIVSSPSPPQVLIVDDYADNRAILKFLLQRRGTIVLEAGDGQEAVEVVQRELPQLVLMDLSMPVMDGFEATRCLKSTSTTRHIPVVAVSAHCGDPEVRHQALEAGCTACLEKPLDLSKLEILLQTLTRNPLSQ